MLKAAEAALNVAATTLSRTTPEWIHEVKQASEALKEDFALAKGDNPQLYGPELHLHRSGDSVRISLRLAFWELTHAPTFEEGVVDATHRGGHAELNGAITGALLGALHSDASLPNALWEPVEKALERDCGPLRSSLPPDPTGPADPLEVDHHHAALRSLFLLRVLTASTGLVIRRRQRQLNARRTLSLLPLPFAAPNLLDDEAVEHGSFSSFAPSQSPVACPP